jgi:hypothetical protein
MGTLKFARAKTYTRSYVADLRSFLENPPEPPANLMSLAEVFEAIRPQAIALIKAGYTVEQLKKFLAAKQLPVTTPEAVRFLRSVAPSTRTLRKSKSEDESQSNASEQPYPEAYGHANAL